MNWLPLDLHYQVILYLPFSEVVKNYPQLEGNNRFWMEKAGITVGKNWQDPEFEQFFNSQNLSNSEKYLRILAYNGIGYQGSECLISWVEIFRHGLQDPDLMEYFWSHFSHIDTSDVRDQIIALLLRSGRVDLLVKFKNYYNFDLSFYNDDFETFFILADENRLKNVNIDKLDRSFKGPVIKYLNDTQCYLRGTCDGEVPLSVLVHAEMRSQTGVFIAKKISYILNQNIDKLKEYIPKIDCK